MAERKRGGAAVAEPEEADESVDQEGGDDEATKPAKQQIREAFQAGRTRREIADEFGLSYQRVYQVTKDLTGEGNAQSRTRVVVQESEALTKAGREDLVGMARVDAIRLLFGEDMKIGDIARLLDCSYQVAFQATRAQRAEAAGESGDEDEDAEGTLETESDDDEEEDEEDEEE